MAAHRKVGASSNKKPTNGVWSAVAIQKHFMEEMGMSGERRTRGRRSLAQKIGVLPETKKLAEEEWERVGKESDKQQRSEEPCSICHEQYTDKVDQVLLSCGHVFHTKCMRNLELFARRTATAAPPACPLCRTADYEKRNYDGGKRVYHHKMATKIQKVWRGFSTRRAVLMWKMETDPVFREEMHFQLVKRISNEELYRAEQRANDLNSFFEKLDRKRTAATLHTITLTDWETARRDLLSRGVEDCIICMNPLAIPVTSAATNTTDVSLAAQSVLLSCSHAFHAPCLASFEEFERCGCIEDRKCPICRAPYITQPLYGE